MRPDMSITDRKLRQKEELREMILTAAEELFVTDGYENVSMRKIARRIEYSPTTIYRHFDSKADIMHHLIARGYVGVYDRYRQVLARGHETPLAALRDILGEYARFALETPNHYELWLATSQMELKGGRLQMRHGDITFHVYHTWLEQIDACRADGLFPGRSTMELFQLLLCSIHGLIVMRLRHPHLPWMDLDRHIAETLTMIERGLLD
jgi:AcrR family transcriptional regulator